MNRERFEEIFVKIVGGPPNELQKNEIIPQFIDAVENSQYMALRVPTGNGKTSMVEAYGELSGNTILLTNTIITQDSIEATGHNAGYDWMSLKGQENYACKIDPSKTVGDVCKTNRNYCKGCKHFATDQTVNNDDLCEYYKRRVDIKNKRIGILSFDKFLADCFWARKKPECNILIIDECDLFVDKVVDYLAIEYPRKTLTDMKVTTQFDFSLPDNHTLEDVLKYLENITKDVNENYMAQYNDHENCLDYLKSFEHATKHDIKCSLHPGKYSLLCKQCDKRQKWIEEKSLSCNECYGCKSLGNEPDHSWYDTDIEKLGEKTDRLNYKLKMIRENQENYVYYKLKDKQDDHNKQKIMIKPVDVKETIRTLVSGYEKVIFLSATCTKEFFNEYIGIKNAKFVDIEKTVIPEDSRLIFKTSSIPLSVSNFELYVPSLASHIYSIGEIHKNQRGLLFYTGKKTYDQLVSGWPENKQEMAGRFQKPGKGDNIEDVYNNFKKTNDGILCISSFSKFARGLNFSDDDCRFQIILKHPKPAYDDPVITAKRLKNNNIDNIIATSTLIQSIGRGVRHKGDWCFTYLLDGNATGSILNDAPAYISESLRKEWRYKKTPDLLVCECCKTKLHGNKYDLHHIQYPVMWNGVLLKSIQCNVHEKCHVKIHHTDEYLHLRPPPGQSNEYYGVKK